MNKEELLYNEIYERTKDFGRTQFVREIMRLQQENKDLYEKQELHLNRIDELTDRVVELETNRDEVIQLLNNARYQNRCTCSYCNEHYLKEMQEILERGKE